MTFNERNQRSCILSIDHPANFYDAVLDNLCIELFGSVVGIRLIDAPVLHPVRIIT